MNSFVSSNPDVMCLCLFRVMEDSRFAKGEVERNFYNIEKKRKSAPTTGVSLIHVCTQTKMSDVVHFYCLLLLFLFKDTFILP